jgi:hypothetical protein
MLAYLDTIIAFAVVMLGFSLLITLLNQTISAFLSYRGSNLRWGIQTMLSTLKPGLSGQAKNIANQILTDSIVSDSILARFGNKRILGPLTQRWRLASAIGPDALVRTLARVAADPKNASIAADLNTLIDEKDEGAKRKLQMVQDTIGTILSGTNYQVQVDDLIKQLGTSVQQSVGKVEAWFDISMKRVAQRFTMQIRIWTVVFAFLMAFGVHLDSLNLFNQLLGNPTARQKILDQSGAMLKEAGDILGTQTSGQATTTEPTTSPEVLTRKMKELIDKDLDKQKEAKPALLGTVPSFTSIAEAEKWLRDNLNADDKRKDELAAKYKGYVITGLKDKAKDVASLLQNVGIQFLPEGRSVPRWYDLSGWVAFLRPDSKRNLLGILLTAGLLALGAPFWYNALKTLTNLRPMVATRQDQQKQAGS